MKEAHLPRRKRPPIFEERINLGDIINASRPDLPEAHSWVDHPYPASESPEGCRRCRKKKPRSRYFEIYGGDVWWWECEKCAFKTITNLAAKRDHAEGINDA